LSEEAKKILNLYWGYTQFRPKQEEIIDSILSGKDTFALLPTGGGKSLTFQIPGLIKEGVCLVITPLIALMKDQVDRLKKLGIPAKALYTGMYPDEIESALSNAIHSKIKLLYVSPERLLNPGFQNTLSKINVNLIAVDEAHCISQWGYNFRPPYLKIADIRIFFPETPVLALTATATPRVVEDIMQKLHFKKSHVVKASFERSNLAYRVFQEADKSGRLLHLLKETRGSAIVYVRNRKKTREIADILVKNKISATYYHAGLDNKTRAERQQYWTQGKIRVMVSTNAFGMGIDKADVRQVIHYNLPDCLESYFQEAGRAGRDGKNAVASLFYTNHDIGHAKKQLTESFPDLKTIRNIYNALGNYFNIPEGSGKDFGYNFKIMDFVNHYGFGLMTCYSAIKLLEKEGYLVYDESSGRSSKLMIKVSNEQIYRFIVENPKFERILKELMRSYGGIFTDYVAINEKIIAKRAEIEKEKLMAAFSYLNKLKIISYVPLQSTPQIFYNTVRLPKENIGFSHENYQDLKKAAAIRLDALVSFLTNGRECRSIQLLKYFGQTQQNRCGICDVCQSMNKTNLSETDFEHLQQQIYQLLQQKPMHLYEMISQIESFEEEKIIAVIQWLIDSRSIERRPDEKLCLSEKLHLDF
jgi:ATP-dependent DNA helicase RecQ